MKTKLLTLAIVVGMTGVASAKVNWEGQIVVTAVTAACGTDTEIGDHSIALYFPSDLADNGDFSFLALYRGNRAGLSMKTDRLAGGEQNLFCNAHFRTGRTGDDYRKVRNLRHYAGDGVSDHTDPRHQWEGHQLLWHPQLHSDDPGCPR